MPTLIVFVLAVAVAIAVPIPLGLLRLPAATIFTRLRGAGKGLASALLFDALLDNSHFANYMFAVCELCLRGLSARNQP